MGRLRTVGAGLLAAVLAACWGGAAWGAETSSASSATSARPASSARSATAARPVKAKEPDRTNGELFPEVKGVSGDELARQIAEYEKRKQNRGTGVPSEPAETPKNPPVVSPAKEAVGAVAATGVKPEKESPFDVLAKKTERLEGFLEVAGNIRRDAEREATKQYDGLTLSREKWIQYLFQYKPCQSDVDVRQYRKDFEFPISVYRQLFELSQNTGNAVRTQGSWAKAGSEGEKKAAELGKRLREVRRKSLLGMGGLFTHIRDLPSAWQVYVKLRADFPEDAEVKKASEEFVKLRDTPEPTPPPYRYSR